MYWTFVGRSSEVGTSVLLLIGVFMIGIWEIDPPTMYIFPCQCRNINSSDIKLYETKGTENISDDSVSV